MEKRNSLDDFNLIIKQIITPLLKKIGFKKSGINYNRQINEAIQIFNIQRESPSSEDDFITFTFNMSVIISEIHTEIRKELYREEKPEAPKEYHGTLRTRLETLAGRPWRVLKNGVNYKELCEQIQNDMLQYGIPWFEKNKTVHSLLDTIEIQDVRHFPSFAERISLFLVYIKAQKFEKAEVYLNEINSEVYAGFDNEIKFFANKYKIKLYTSPKNQ
jgi:hypothetical protein